MYLVNIVRGCECLQVIMRVKNIVSVGSLLLLGVALACSVTYVVKSHNKQSKLIESDLEFNANFVSVWLKTAFYHSNDVLHQLSDTLEQDGFATLPLSAKSYQEQSGVFEFQYETLINAIHVFVVNKNCILLNTKTIGGVDLSSREYCQTLKQNDENIESVITSPFKDILNRNVIVQGVKITDENNNFAGVVGILTDFTFFNQSLKNVKLSENSTISILSSDFTVLASSAPQYLPIGEKIDFSYIPKNKIKGLKYDQKVMFDSAKTYNGEHQGVLVKKVSDLPFMILVTKAKYYWFTPLYITVFIVSVLMILLSFLLFKNAYYFQTLLYQAEHYSKLALYDELTGVCNRRCFEKVMSSFIEKYKDEGVVFSLVIFDIDFFKEINDTHGHDRGDEVLRVFSKTCSSVMSPEDIFARLGGDEFVMIMANKTSQEAALIMTELLHEIRRLSVITSKGELKISSSIGITQSKTKNDDFSVLLERADKALYQVKRSGRNGVVVR